MFQVLRFKFHDRSGQSLVEVLVSIAVGIIFVVAALSVLSPALKINTEAGRIQAGAALGRDLLDRVRVWSDGDWHRIAGLATSSANKFYLVGASPYASSSGEESLVVSSTTFKRFFYVDDVYRDTSDLIASNGTSYDPSTKKVTVVYKWAPLNATHTIVEYVARYRQNIFDQTDWSGGPGQSGVITSTNPRFSTSSNINYSSTTGSIKIKFPASGGGCPSGQTNPYLGCVDGALYCGYINSCGYDECSTNADCGSRAPGTGCPCGGGVFKILCC